MTSFAEKTIMGNNGQKANSWLPCKIHSVSRSTTAAYNCSPERMLEPKNSPTDSSWITYAQFSHLNCPHVTFQLGSKSLLSYVELHNMQTSAVTIQVGMKEGKHNFITIKENYKLARNRINEIPIGHIPCRFVRLICLSGKPVSINQIRFNGISTLNVNDRMGPSTEYLLYKATENILYGDSLRISRPIAKKPAEKMQKVGGDAPNKSYSYTTNLTTPESNVISRDGGLVLSGHNMASKKLEDALNNMSAIPDSPNLYDILPEGVGGKVSKLRDNIHHVANEFLAMKA